MTATRTDRPRLAWLDGLRGYAAVVVVAFHLSPVVIGSRAHATLGDHFDMGKYGVLLFFLVSGYVIPMSLERHGSPRRFWIGRIFRIYPAYLLTIAAAGGLTLAGVLGLPSSLRQETVSGVLGHLTMLQEFVGARGLARPFWTLSFEMTFYLVVVGLFIWGLHRRSAFWAGGLMLVSATAGTTLPENLLGPTIADRRLLAVVLTLLFAASLVAYVAGRRYLVLVAGLAGLCFVALPLLNGRSTQWGTANSSWQATFMLAVMFAGTVVYRAQHGQISRRLALPVLALVAVGVALTTWLQGGDKHELIKWCTTSAAVTVSFAIAFALRHRRVPAGLVWLGAISYSLYLLHVVVLHLFLHFTPESVRDTGPARTVFGLVVMAAALAAAWVSHRFVEQPGQSVGRTVQGYADGLLGPDRWQRPTAGPATETATPRERVTAPV